jgi:acyl carrier protein
MERETVFFKLNEILKDLLVEEVEITEETALLSDSILDSLEFMNYITTIEEIFNVSIQDEDVAKFQLGIVKNMVDYLST